MGAEQFLTARECWTLLGVSERTFYRIPFFRTRKIYVTATAVRYAVSDLKRFQAIRRAA